MRLSADTSNSQPSNSRPLSNGSTLSPLHKTALSNSTNGTTHVSPITNGSVHTNGVSSSQGKALPEYFGHDREEVTRILIQGLNDLGYGGAAAALTHESGFALESSAVAAFRRSVLHGEWTEAESLLFGEDSDHKGKRGSHGDLTRPSNGLVLREEADRDEMLFQLRQQKFLELLEIRDLGSALMVLRQELAPLQNDRGRLPALSSLMMCQSSEDLRLRADWDGSNGRSRQNLLSQLSISISPSVMVPEHRLADLLQQVKRNQISNCKYHSVAGSPSLYSDHMCDPSQFPSRTIHELHTHTNQVWYLEFSHDGKRLATSSLDKSVIIYDTLNFDVLHVLAEHEEGVCYVAWSPDDTKIISCSLDYRAKLWDTQTGKCLVTINHHLQPVSSACWAPDGKTFVTGSMDNSSPVCLWDLKGELRYQWKQKHNCRVQDVRISPDASLMVTVSETNIIHLYNFATREELKCEKIETQDITSVKFTQDSAYILINRSDNEIQILDVRTFKPVRRFTGQRQGNYVVKSCFGGADENFVISGSEDSHIYIWHKENSSLLEKFEAHPGVINCVSWNPKNPRMFASCGDDQKVRIWGPDPNKASQWGGPSSSVFLSR